MKRFPHLRPELTSSKTANSAAVEIKRRSGILTYDCSLVSFCAFLLRGVRRASDTYQG
jgi:phosphopantetheine adenylyltransferase